MTYTHNIYLKIETSQLRSWKINLLEIFVLHRGHCIACSSRACACKQKRSGVYRVSGVLSKCNA